MAEIQSDFLMEKGIYAKAVKEVYEYLLSCEEPYDFELQTTNGMYDAYGRPNSVRVFYRIDSDWEVVKRVNVIFNVLRIEEQIKNGADKIVID